MGRTYTHTHQHNTPTKMRQNRLVCVCVEKEEVKVLHAIRNKEYEEKAREKRNKLEDY